MKPDKELVRRRFERKLAQYHNLARVQQGIAGELASLYRHHFGGMDVHKIFEAGAGTGFLTRLLKEFHPRARFFLNDLTESAGDYLRGIMQEGQAEYIWGDAEKIALPAELDAVVSSSTVQWFEDLPSFIVKAASATVPRGALAISTFGPDNFREIRTINGYGLDYHTKTELGLMAESAGYEILHLSEQTRILYFDIPVDVLYHIRATGVNAVRHVQWDRNRSKEFTDRYRELFMTRDGLYPLTYHPVFLVARKK